MGYACPVCSDPQADAGHLANHLAFTALLGDDDHEAWLDDHAPGWGEMGEVDLANELVEHVDETEFPQLFEDTAGGLESGPVESTEERTGALFDEEHGHGHGSSHEHDHGHRDQAVDGPTDEETAEILAEARELTRQMRDKADNADDTEGANDE
jgi:hypothetical protein